MSGSGAPLPAQPPQPTVALDNSSFLDNLAWCSGAGCQSIGGAVQVTVASGVRVGAATAAGNTAVCAGAACSSQGGWLSYQNGPAVPGGVGNIGNAAGTVAIAAVLHGFEK